MRTSMALIVAAFFVSSSGCTSTQLRHSTVRQVSTLTELQHQIVLNNLAAFACNEWAIPAQATITDGTAQVSDSGNVAGQLVTDWAAMLGLSRTVVDQWNVVPVTNELTLKLLRRSYRRALGFSEIDLRDMANDLAHELKKQTVVVDDMRTVNQWMPELKVDAATDDITREKLNAYRKKAAIIADAVISSNSEKLISDDEILATFEPSKPTQCKLVTPLAAEVRRQVKELDKQFREIEPGWLGCGGKHDVPDCVCWVGHHKSCDCECYVWVVPGCEKQFEDFVLTSLAFSSLIQETQVIGIPGVRYSPTTTRR